MSAIITEKDYPIHGLWVFKSFIIGLPVLIVFGFLYTDSENNNNEFLIYLAILVLFIFVINLKRINFHYSVEDKYLTVKQGILSKQQRHIPYGVIQNIFIKQDLFDRVFGLASIAVENAAQGGTSSTDSQAKIFGMRIGERRQQIEMLGFAGNKINIPGLTKKDAETLKEIILRKMKENPIEDSQSGL